MKPKSDGSDGGERYSEMSWDTRSMQLLNELLFHLVCLMKLELAALTMFKPAIYYENCSSKTRLRLNICNWIDKSAQDLKSTRRLFWSIASWFDTREYYGSSTSCISYINTGWLHGWNSWLSWIDLKICSITFVTASAVVQTKQPQTSNISPAYIKLSTVDIFLVRETRVPEAFGG